MKYFYEITPSSKPAIVSSDGEVVTYRDLYEEIEKAKPLLRKRSLAFCLCENSPSSITAYLTCMNSGLVPLLLDRKIDRALLADLLKAYEPYYLFLPRELEEEFSGWHRIHDMKTYTVLENDIYPDYELNDDLAMLLTTSGSTGSPKLVRQSYLNIQSNAEAIAEYLEITESERPVTTLPMNYTYGLSIINSHLVAGATMYTTEYPINFKPFWDFVRANGITSFGGVPFTYVMLKKIRFFKMDLPDLRYVTQAGGKLDPELHAEFAEWAEKTGKKFIVMYGQTEASPRMGYLPREMCSVKKGSMGIAIPGGEFMLLDANDEVITEPEIVGELVYRGPNVTLGYAESKYDLSKGDERHGVLATGDMAKRDADGYYYIVGRKKRFLKIYGNRVNLDETDRLIMARYPDADCASTGVDDHMTIYVTDENILAELREWISSVTHLSQGAFDIRYIPEIPRNEAGKVLYKDLPTE